MSSIFENNFALNKAHRDSIFKSEGSRGGKVIGHTKSGKPIYADKDAHAPEYLYFTREDHNDAHKEHNKISEELLNSREYENEDRDTVKKKIHHGDMSQSHYSKHLAATRAELELDQKRKDTIAKIKDPSLKEGLRR